MNTTRSFATLLCAGAVALATGCASLRQDTRMDAFAQPRVTTHRDGDDLLTAGLGLAGLRAAAPGFADATHPTPVELRRRAIWSNWHGIADLTPAGGYGTLYGSTANVPGREYATFARVPGASQPHRVAVQVPDTFDAKRRCIVVAPSSGSRGVYGAISVAGAWGLPKGCAVAYTDKGGGTDYFDLDAGQGIALDGTVQAAGSAPLAFEPSQRTGHGIAFKHAHSGDNPEKDWGLHVKQAAEFALNALDDAFPAQAPFRFDNTTVIAVAVSNGGGAVLRAAELDGDWLDAVVAGEPNVNAGDAPTLYDITTEAALLMPCALGHLQVPLPPTAGPKCGEIADAKLVKGATDADRARDAYDQLRARGWTDDALRSGGLSVSFDLWKSIAATYASAYGRFGPDAHPCGFTFGAIDANGAPRAATDAERAAWWADASGIPPGAGVVLLPPKKAPIDTLLCLRGLWTGTGDAAGRVRAGIRETHASLPRAGIPITVVHGTDDGLIPVAFTSAPYVQAARAAGRDVRFWQVRNAQHFDAFLQLPPVGARYVPLLPYVYAALDRTWAHLYEGAAMPGDALIQTTPRGTDAELTARHLAVPTP
ncbi:3-hydroxybutyrate oligomer hydrolase family protein [Lysobacter claricitrinus]|uniref:3-hydroxybutyrate oligomer hydrolase family protein n=1 Tax=Lysobacter claricitrinus TaxID=3367728 RepID=UPI0037DB4341